MASREETLLFIVDVQVRNSQALRQLSHDIAAMQAEQDRRMESLNTANRGLIEGGGSGTGGGAGPSVVPGSNQPAQGSGSQIVGVRSSHAPGSRMNPIVTVQESGLAGGLGSLAAGAPNASSEGGGPSASDIANAIQAQNPNAGGIDPQVIDQTIRDVTTKVVAPENDRVIQAIQAQTDAQHRVAQAITGGGSGPSVAQNAVNRQAMAQDLANALAGRRAQMPQPQRTMTTGDAAQVLGRPRTVIREMAATGAIPGAQKQQGQWMLPEDQVEKMLEDIENAKAGGGGAGGGGRPPVALGAGGGGAGRGGGGSRFQWSPFGGSRSNPDSGTSGPFSFGNLFKGDGGRGGAFGLPSFGSVGSLGGLGLEHWILSALGVGASATSAIGGASLLGSASITKSIVGGGADALVNKTTITDAKNYQTQLSALNEAIAVYGKGSTQAAAAQYALNQTVKDMGGPADVTAIKTLDSQVQNLRVSFDQASAAARVSSADIDIQVVGLAQTYVPAVTQAAQRNLALINTAIKPLFTWLEGPQGMGIFRSMENSFATGLPTTIHAASMAIEDFLRLMQAALPYTGGLSRDLDNLFTEKNKESTAAYDAEVQKLVGDLRLWENLLKLLGQDMSLVFKQDAGTANSIVQALTDMLQKLHNWEESSQGQSQLKTIFAVHKEQILALIKVFENLAGDYGSFYMDVAPSMVGAVTDIAKAFSAVADAISKIPGGSDILGFGLVAAKLKILMPLLKSTAALMFGIDAAEKGGSGGGVGGLSKLLLGGGETAAGTGAAGAAKSAVTGTEESVAGGAAGAASAGGIAKLLAKLGAGGGDSVVTQAMVTDALKYAAMGSGLAAATTLGVMLLNHFGTNDKNAPRVTGVGGAQYVNPRVGPNVSPTGFAGMNPQSTANYAKEGQQAAQQFIQGMQEVKFPSTLSVFEGMDKQLQSLKPQARDAAAQSMLAYAQELQSEGKLPQGAVKNLLQLIEAQFPALRTYLKKEGSGAASDFSDALNLKEAVSNTKSAVANLKQEFGNIFDNTTTTSGNMLQQVTKDFSTLKGNMGSLTKQGQQQASQNLTQLKQTALSDATAMEQQVSNKMGILANNIASGSQSALNSATGDFSALASNIATAIGSGALASGKGTQLIAEGMNDQLKALGAKPIPMVALKSLSVKQLLGEQHFITHGGPSNAGHGATAATGALLQIGQAGKAGGDNVPMRVGNTDVMVGEGEQVAVINRHQQPIINRALAREGYAGLPGLFNSIRTPNYMAGGGLVPGFAGGGNVNKGNESLVTASWYFGGTTADGQDADTTMGFAELSSNTPSASGAGDNFSALGNLPMHTMIAVTYPPTPGGKTINIPKIDVGGGGSAIPPATIRAVDLTPPAKAALNFPGLANVLVNIGNVGPATGGAGGSGASWQDMSAPKVTGTGAIADLVDAVLGKATTAANVYGRKQAALLEPASTGAAGEGVPSFPVHKGPVPAQVQDAKNLANAIVDRHVPYGHEGAGWGLGAYDCSSFESTVFDAAGIAPWHKWVYYTAAGPINDVTVPGPGKWITVGTWGSSGQDAHTMFEIDGEFFESGGQTTQGPHRDSGWSQQFDSYRHPPGYAGGGLMKGQVGYQPTAAQAAAIQAQRNKLGSGTGSVWGANGILGGGATGAGGVALSTSEQAFVKKNKGKPKSGKKAKAPKYKLTGGPAKLDTHGLTKFGVPPVGGALPFDDTTDLSNIDAMLNAIYAIAGGADGIPGTGNIMGLEDDISYYTSAWGAGIASPPYPNAAGSFFGSFSSPSDFVTSTTDSSGNTTYAIDPNINTVAGQLSQMIGWQNGIVGDLTGANTQSGAVQGPINKAITRRVNEMAKIKKQVAENVKTITAYQKKISDAKKKVVALKAAYKQLAIKQAAAIKTQAATVKQLNAENAKKKPNKTTVASLAKLAVQQQGIVDGIDSQMVQNIAQQNTIGKVTIPGYQADIVPYETQNVALGGKKDSMGSGGQWGGLSSELGTAASGTSGIGLAEGGGNAASGLYGLLSTVQSWQAAIGGTNGDLAQQALTATEWQGDYNALIPGANSALVADQTSSATAGNSTSPITGTVAFQFNGNEVLASTLQGMAQGGLLPWAGSFMTGGVIPGPIGASALAEVHGGEVITNPYLPGAGGDTSGLSTAMSQLTSALCDHKTAVMQNTTAMKSNTTAVSSTTGGGAGVRYSGGAYSQHTSSDSIVGVGIGS